MICEEPVHVFAEAHLNMLTRTKSRRLIWSALYDRRMNKHKLVSPARYKQRLSGHGRLTAGGALYAYYDYDFESRLGTVLQAGPPQPPGL